MSEGIECFIWFAQELKDGGQETQAMIESCIRQVEEFMNVNLKRNFPNAYDGAVLRYDFRKNPEHKLVYVDVITPQHELMDELSAALHDSLNGMLIGALPELLGRTKIFVGPAKPPAHVFQS
jgi:hypothetical protein